MSTRFTEFQALLGETIITDNGVTLNYDTAIATMHPFASCNHQNIQRVSHPLCAGIPVPPNDTIHQIYPDQTCMPFMRTVPCARCRLGPRLITNSVTAAHDLNAVYGVSTEMSNARRTMTGGRLKSQILNGHEIFGIEQYNATGRYRCFEGRCELSPYDARNVQFPTGQAYTLLFYRNHNRHARNLEKIQPLWSDERIFQEARR